MMNKNFGNTSAQHVQIIDDVLYCLTNTTAQVKSRRGQDLHGVEYTVIQGNAPIYKIYLNSEILSVSKFPGGGYQNENIAISNDSTDARKLKRILQRRTHPNYFHKIVRNWNVFRTNVADINMIETALMNKNTHVENSGNVYGIHFDLPEIPDCKMTINFRRHWVEFGFGEQNNKKPMLTQGYIGLKLRVLQKFLTQATVR